MIERCSLGNSFRETDDRIHPECIECIRTSSKRLIKHDDGESITTIPPDSFLFDLAYSTSIGRIGIGSEREVALTIETDDGDGSTQLISYLMNCDKN
jgi:hypothetical protein